MVAARSNWEPITSTTSKRRHHVLDVPLGLDRTVGNQSLQVHASLRSAILDGRLVAGLRLPSSRSLADQLSVRRNAIVGAYEHLLSDGLVETRVGDGTYVASRLPTRADQITVAPFVVAANQRGAFALGQTHSDPMVLRRLASATRRRIASATAAYLGYGDPRGGEALRRQIALHLAANRGIRCDPSCILIVSGTQQGVRLCADALLRSGDRVWMEDPGYPATRNTLAAAGMRLVPVPVDAEGIDVAAGRRLGPSAKAVYVTPFSRAPDAHALSHCPGRDCGHAGTSRTWSTATRRPDAGASHAGPPSGRTTEGCCSQNSRDRKDRSMATIGDAPRAVWARRVHPRLRRPRHHGADGGREQTWASGSNLPWVFRSPTYSRYDGPDLTRSSSEAAAILETLKLDLRATNPGS